MLLFNHNSPPSSWCVRAGVTNTLPPHLKHLLCLWSKVPLGYFFYFPCPMRINHTPSGCIQSVSPLFHSSERIDRFTFASSPMT